MQYEIERKFLVVGDAWRALTHKRETLVDGLVAASEGRKVRVRLYPDRATLTIKSARDGLTRVEYEYEIPPTDAAELIAKECGDKVTAKTRHHVAHQGFVWHVDEYVDLLAGVIIAEVELESEATPVPLPDWVDREVTFDPAYRKINMVNARLAQSRDGGGRSALPRLDA
jgi:adenylate cyclase